MPNWKKVVVSGSDASLNSLYSSGPITGSDVQIDDWGSISASLVQIQGTASLVPTLDQVVTAGNFTTGDILATNFATLTGAGYMEAGSFGKKGISSTGILFNSSTWSAFSESIDIQLGSAASPLVMYRDNSDAGFGVQQSTHAIWNDNKGDFSFTVRASGSGASLQITSTGPGEENTTATFGGQVVSTDISIDDWGSVSASLVDIQSGVGALSFQAVTDTGNTTTNDIEVEGTITVGTSGLVSSYGRNIAFNGLNLPIGYDDRGLASIPPSYFESGINIPTQNVAIGLGVLGAVTSSASNEGSYNVGIGTAALSENTTGKFNTAIGTGTLANNLTGGNNVSIGYNALSSNTTFGSNNAIGSQALSSLVTGSLNNALGAEALKAMTSGSKNTAIGNRAAYTNTSAHDSIFLGYYAKPLNNGEVNQVVIGHQAIGNGSNTVTIGNSSITNNYFFGDIDADDVTIDGWGSVSSSLASLTSLSSPTLQDVTDNGNTTTNVLEVGGISGSGDFHINKTVPKLVLTNSGSTGAPNNFVAPSIRLETDAWGSAPSGKVMGALSVTTENASHKGSLSFDKATEDLSDIKFYNTNFGNNIKPALNISSSGDLFVSASVSSSDAYIDGWGSISESLANIESGTATLNLQDVTNVGSTTTTSITAANFSGSYIKLDGTTPSHEEGVLFYDSAEGALGFYNAEADITLQIGQEFWQRVRNTSGATITNGTPVRVSGSQGDTPLIWPAVAVDHTNASVSEVNENHVIGVATHDIENSSLGYITEAGLVRNLNTSAFNAGDTLYLQTGSAGFRNTPPPFPYDIVKIGTVIRSNPGDGFISINPREPVHFANISGLSGSAYEPGDLWVYQSNGAWSPTKTLSGSYTIDNGNLTVGGDIDSDDVTIDDWGSVSSSLSSIESTATSLTLADVTANGNGSTGDVAINGDLDADDVTIDDWGSLSASLAAIETTGTAIPTLDQVVTAGNTTSGSIEVQNITVNGTGSFAFIQSVTGSAKIIGDAYIILNADSPSERYAGIKVYDSGSTGETGSLEYDSVANHWFYESVNEGYASILMSGPKASRGSLSVPTSGSLVVAAGNHLYSSNVSDLNGVVSVATDLVVTGSTIQNGITEFQSGKITVNDSSTGIIGGDNAASTYAGAVLDYVVYDGARNNQRTGTVQVSANTSTVVHSENVTTDIGGTDGMQITTTMNSTNFRINMVNSSGNTIYVSYNLKLLKV